MLINVILFEEPISNTIFIYSACNFKFICLPETKEKCSIWLPFPFLHCFFSECFLFSSTQRFFTSSLTSLLNFLSFGATLAWSIFSWILRNMISLFLFCERSSLQVITSSPFVFIKFFSWLNNRFFTSLRYYHTDLYLVLWQPSSCLYIEASFHLCIHFVNILPT